MYNENTVIALIRGISVVTCVEIWKRFLVQREILVQKNSKQFQPVLNFFRSEYKSMNLESEAEKISSKIFMKTSFVVKNRKVKTPT